MSTEKNKANVRRLIEEVYSGGKLSVLGELLAPAYVYHDSTGDIKGPEGMKQNVTAYKKALPDMKVKVDRLVAEGDMVAGVITYTGTFKGELMGMAPTGKSLKMSALVLSRHGKDGRQLEAWPYYDNLSFYRQLGIPLPKKK
jgi:predicted ester cyclase